MTGLKEKLIHLYAEMAQMTLSECQRCRNPLSCCSPEFCALAIEHARSHWGIALQATSHPTLPLMGSNGCVAPPHLRPCCTAHTCEINAYGCKRNDPAWTEKYFQLRDAIMEIEAQLWYATPSESEDNKNHCHQGFSLVELVIVLMILGLLLAVIFRPSSGSHNIPETLQQSREATSSLNVVILQEAYERAKLQAPQVLTNQTIPGLVSDLMQYGLLTPFDATPLRIHSGSISNGTAVFELNL